MIPLIRGSTSFTLERWDTEGRDQKLLNRFDCRLMRGKVVRDLRAFLDARIIQIVRLPGFAIQDFAVAALREQTVARRLRLRELERLR